MRNPLMQVAESRNMIGFAGRGHALQVLCKRYALTLVRGMLTTRRRYNNRTVQSVVDVRCNDSFSVVDVRCNDNFSAVDVRYSPQQRA
jgi:hypothetical protein